MSHILIPSNLDNFFYKEICRSAKSQNLFIKDNLASYLSAIMKKAILCNTIVGKDITLAEIYLKKEENKDRFLNFKKIGDISIVKIGLFPGTKSSLVSRGYYLDMASTAYDFCYKKSGDKTYKDLSGNVDKCCDIIYGAKSCAITNNIIDLYDDWRNTKSKFSKRRLIALGFSFKDISLLEH